jgi:hypothetical protein
MAIARPAPTSNARAPSTWAPLSQSCGEVPEVFEVQIEYDLGRPHSIEVHCRITVASSR